MLIYVSALLATGLAPLVAVVERQRLIPGRRLPRWAAILIIYVLFLIVLVAFARLVTGPLIAQAVELVERLCRTWCSDGSSGHFNAAS